MSDPIVFSVQKSSMTLTFVANKKQLLKMFWMLHEGITGISKKLMAGKQPDQTQIFLSPLL